MTRTYFLLGIALSATSIALYAAEEPLHHRLVFSASGVPYWKPTQEERLHIAQEMVEPPASAHIK